MHELIQNIEMQLSVYTGKINNLRNYKVNKANAKSIYTPIPKMTIRSERYKLEVFPEYTETDSALRIRWYRYDS
ncbi:hypothetical protein KUL152_32810 [Tenacibaculum sp. KUL152]|nr:hypothetical protein KUL152_32810 [Tenacibaculum sp. KUL152]GFD94614.1 hypothetical protein KUL154_33470 [Alteromonas sp. KUL154]GFE03571.1 hypothetical protein KUL156_61630 [Alteromonas sp. KUL156]